MFKVQIALGSRCLDTAPSRNWCPGTDAGPHSLVSWLGSKMLTAGGGRFLEQLDLLFGFHFGLLYKWLILLSRADLCVLGMMVITLSLRVTAQHRTAAPSLLAPAKLSHLIRPWLVPEARAALRLVHSCLGAFTDVDSVPKASSLLVLTHPPSPHQIQPST